MSRPTDISGGGGSFGQLWDDLLSPDDRLVIETGSYGRTQDLTGLPALLLIDFQYGYLGADESTANQISEWPSGGGTPAWNALRSALPLLDAARRASAVVVMTRIAYPTAASASESTFSAKRGQASSFVDGQPGTKLAAELSPTATDLIVTKRAASAFHETGLHTYLREHDVDSLLVAGLSTSGCVRATVVDAASYGYRTAVVVEATADRIALSRRVTLLDIWMKYGTLLWLAEAMGIYA